MPRVRILALVVLAAALLALPATAQAKSGVRLRGTVTLKDASHRLLSVRATKRAFDLRVRSSMQRVRLGERVELRGSTLRTQGQSSHVVATNVSVLRSHSPSGAADTSSGPGSAGSSGPSAGDDDQGENEDQDNDELEVKGTITSLSPLTVSTPSGPKSCVVPTGMTLTGFAVNDFVEMKCDLVGGTFVLRELQHEDQEDAAGNDDHGGSSGPAAGDDDNSGSSGPGSDDDGGDDNSGGGGDD